MGDGLADIGVASGRSLIGVVGTLRALMWEGDAMRTVEVIEDDPAMRALLLEWLADEGYRVRVHGPTGVAATCAADAVVVDLSNEQLQGAEAIRHASSRFAPAAVIGLSTRLIHAPASASLQAHTLGLDELLPKPCSRQALVAAVARAIGAAR